MSLAIPFPMKTTNDNFGKITCSRLLVCIAALMIGGCESIDKGLYQAANATSQKDRVTGQRELSLHNRQQQIAQGNQASEQMIQSLREKGVRMNEALDNNVYERVRQAFARILSVSHLRDEKWTVVVLDEPSFNAFVTGGTYIFVHSGLVEQTESIDELAAVMGHELAHAASNHGFQRRDQLALASLTGSDSAKRGSFAAAFTHEQEAEADKIGILYCALAGFDPNAASRVWSRLAAEQGDQRAVGFYNDHPVNTERAAQAKSVADAVSRYYTNRQVNPDFQNILANNILWQNRSGKEVQAGKGGGFLAALEVAATTIAAHQKAKIEETRQTQLNQMVELVRSNTSFQRWERVSPTILRLFFSYRGPYQVRNIQFLCTFTVDGVNRQTLVCNSGQITAQGDFYCDVSDGRFANRSLQLAPAVVTSAN